MTRTQFTNKLLNVIMDDWNEKGYKGYSNMKKKQETKWYLFEDALFNGRKINDRRKRHAISRVENIIFIELPGPFKLVGCKQDHGKTIMLTFSTKDRKP